MNSMKSTCKKNFIWILLAFCFVLASASAFVCAFIDVYAETENSENTEDAALFLPSSYEQYLGLEAPGGIAISEKYIAVTDANRIYICTREKETYRVFTHGTVGSNFGNIQIVEDKLYFTDAAMQLYSLSLNADDLLEQKEAYNLVNFVVTDSKIYGTTSSGTTTTLYALASDGTTSISETDPLQSNLPAQLPMTYADGVLYYAVNNLIFRVDTATDEQSNFLTLPTNSLISPYAIARLDQYIFYTDKTGLYYANVAGTEEEASVHCKRHRIFLAYRL